MHVAGKTALAGGVAANLPLREEVAAKAKANGFGFNCPRLELCTDNAAMIGCCAYYEYQAGKRAKLDLNAVASLSMDERQLKD